MIDYLFSLLNAENGKILFIVVLFLYRENIKEKRIEKRSVLSLEVHERLASTIKEGNYMLECLQRGNNGVVDKEQAKAIIAKALHSTKKSLINELKIRKERNGIKVRREQIETSLQEYISLRTKGDNGLFKLFKIEGKTLDVFTELSWLTSTYDLCSDYIFEGISTDSFSSSMDGLFSGYVQNIHSKITELKK